jgi:hypothetical protein
MRTLSSAQTWWIKYLNPSAFALVMIGQGVWLGVILYRPPLVSSVSGAWQLLVLFCIVATLLTFLIAWQGLPLKRVRMDDEALYISNYFREIRVPLSNMEHVSEFLGRRQGNRVTITLRDDTPFGREVVFMPPLSWSRRGKVDPVVGELRALIRQGDIP